MDYYKIRIFDEIIGDEFIPDDLECEQLGHDVFVIFKYKIGRIKRVIGFNDYISKKSGFYNIYVDKYYCVRFKCSIFNGWHIYLSYSTKGKF